MKIIIFIILICSSLESYSQTTYDALRANTCAKWLKEAHDDLTKEEYKNLILEGKIDSLENVIGKLQMKLEAFEYEKLLSQAEELKRISKEYNLNFNTDSLIKAKHPLEQKYFKTY